jgi:hypothetical protein
MARRLTRFAGILGLLFLAYGIGWLAIWNGGAQGDSSVSWLASELRPPSEARLMALAGLFLLLVSSLSWLIRRLFARKVPAKVPKP